MFKRFYHPAIYIVLIAVLAFTACEKGPSGMTVNLTAADSNKTISVVKGEKILITLGNPGDGGFSFDSWQYNSSVLTLGKHTRNLPPANAPTGDFGSDTWQFTAAASGTSTLKITATQSPVEVVTMFSGNVVVK